MKWEFILGVFIFFTANCFAQNNNYASKLQPVLLPNITDSVFEGYYEVLENRSSNSGRKIKIYILVIPSVNKTNNPPIFYIEGGPGVAATKNASWLSDTIYPYRQNNDVVLVDVRGTGKSNPLNCPSLQEKLNLEEQFTDMYPVEAVKDCYRLLSKENDLRQYNSTNVVKDLEEIRSWLGYSKINLYGLSYGTRVVLMYMKMFPRSIASSVLFSPTPTYAKMPLYHARFAQNVLELLWNDCKKDTGCSSSYPNIKTEFAALMKAWKEKPLNYVWKDSLGNEKTMHISWDVFQTKIRSLMYAPISMRTIPYIIHEAWKGNLTPFVDLYPQGKSDNSFIAEGFYLCVTCAEDVPFIKDAEIHQQVKGTFMGSYRIDQQQQACANWIRGSIPANFLAPVVSSVPTLVLSGSFDPVTPVSWAVEIAKKLSKSKLVIIPDMAHVFDGLSNENCFDNLVMEFIASPDKPVLHTQCVTQMLPPPFKTKK